jgi:hypothetical protein
VVGQEEKADHQCVQYRRSSKGYQVPGYRERLEVSQKVMWGLPGPEEAQEGWPGEPEAWVLRERD